MRFDIKALAMLHGLQVFGGEGGAGGAAGGSSGAAQAQTVQVLRA